MNILKRLYLILFLPILLFSGGCNYYKQDILFRFEGNKDWNTLEMIKKHADANYVISKNDWIEVQLFGNKGEIILDPNGELQRALGGQVMSQGLNIVGATLDNTNNRGRFLVDSKGFAVLPLLGPVKLDSLTYRQADSLLSQLYNKYYIDAFVITRTTNRRCFVFAPMTMMMMGGGGMMAQPGRVLPMQSDRMTLIEVLAQSGGIPIYSKGNDIKIIRGNLNNPQVQTVDLSTVEGLMKADLMIYPNDIIYITPGRRPAFDFTRDYIQVFSAVTSIVTLVTTVVLLSRGGR